MVRSIPSTRETQYMSGNPAPRSWRQEEASLKGRKFMPGLQEDGVFKSSLGCVVRLKFLCMPLGPCYGKKWRRAGVPWSLGHSLVKMATDKSPLLRTVVMSMLRTDSGLCSSSDVMDAEGLENMMGESSPAALAVCEGARAVRCALSLWVLQAV